MAPLDLTACKSFTWDQKTSTGCKVAFNKRLQLKRHGVTIVGHLIYMIAGSRQKGHRGVFALNITTLTWKHVKDAEYFLAHGHQPLLVQDKLYNFGSYPLPSSRGSPPVQYFDLILQKVETCPCEDPEKVPRDEYAGQYIERLGLVVLYGGSAFNEHVVLRSIVAFNVATTRWREVVVKGGTPPPRRNHGSCLHGKSDIFFAGGCKDSTNWPCAEVFHLNCAQARFVWSEVRWTPSPQARADSVMCCVGHRVYIYGGYHTSGKLASDRLYVYDLKDNDGVEFPSSSATTYAEYRIHGEVRPNALHAAVASPRGMFILGGRGVPANAVMVLSPAAD